MEVYQVAHSQTFKRNQLCLNLNAQPMALILFPKYRFIVPSGIT